MRLAFRSERPRRGRASRPRCGRSDGAKPLEAILQRSPSRDRHPSPELDGAHPQVREQERARHGPEHRGLWWSRDGERAIAGALPMRSRCSLPRLIGSGAGGGSFKQWNELGAAEGARNGPEQALGMVRSDVALQGEEQEARASAVVRR